MFLSLLERETIRRAYQVEGKCIRQMSRETGHCRDAIRKAITAGETPTSILVNKSFRRACTPG